MLTGFPQPANNKNFPTLSLPNYYFLDQVFVFYSKFSLARTTKANIARTKKAYTNVHLRS